MIDKLYNEPPFENMPVLVQRTLADQCMKGLIIAKLIGRVNYNQLVITFDKLIMTLDNIGILKKYTLIKEYLSSGLDGHIDIKKQTN